MKAVLLIFFLTFSACKGEKHLSQEGAAAPEPAPALSEEDDEDNDDQSYTCKADRDCKRKCDQATRNKTEREICLDLSPSLLESFYRSMTSYLKSPIEHGQLSQIEPEDIKNIMKISPRRLEKNVHQYSKEDAVKVLKWIARDKAAAGAFYSGSSDKKEKAEDILEELFSKISPKLRDAMRYSFDGRTFAEKTSRNVYASSWSASLFKDKCLSQASYTYSVSASLKADICTLGELYCYRGGQLFKSAFADIVDESPDIMDYIRGAGGLNLKQKDSLNLTKVCKSFCKKFKSAPSC